MAVFRKNIGHPLLFNFLLDILKLALTGFGGPQMHFTQFHKLLVLKKKYISEEELKELNSLCSMLPGPTSTQTITAIGYRLGGPLWAFLTLTVWIIPACMIMLCFAIVVTKLEISNPKLDFLKFIQPMAVGFIVYAAYQITVLFIQRTMHWIFMFTSAALAIAIDTPYIYPIILFLAGFISSQVKKSKYKNFKKIRIVPWGNFVLFISIFLLAALVGFLTKNKAVLIFENTYRFGSLVFGGGHVLIPMMYNQFVVHKDYLAPHEFLAGVGVLQALPGPVFSFSTFAGAMSLNEWGVSGMVLGGILGTVAIFLPGVLLIFFIYPIWAQVKQHPLIKNAIDGINAASAGLVLASAYILFKPVDINEANMLVLLSTLFLLLSTKIPKPIVVLLCIIAGLIY